jgi:hypothetical protein
VSRAAETDMLDSGMLSRLAAQFLGSNFGQRSPLAVRCWLLAVVWLGLAAPGFAQTALGREGSLAMELVGLPVSLPVRPAISNLATGKPATEIRYGRLSRAAWQEIPFESPTWRGNWLWEWQLPERAAKSMAISGSRTVKIRLRSQRISGDGETRIVSGVVEDDPHSHVVLAERQGYFVGSISMDWGWEAFEIRSSNQAQALSDEFLVEIKRVDLTRQPGCGGALLDPEELVGSAKQKAIRLPLTDGGDTLDGAIFYTSEAATAAGGVNPLRTAVEAAIERVNLVWSNSQIQWRFRLVYFGPSTLQESGSINADIVAFRNDLTQQNLRNQYRADHAHLITGDSPYVENICGIGYIPSLVQPSDIAFLSTPLAVTRRECLNFFTFTHEVGHNLGLNHEFNEGRPSYSYLPDSFGYWQTNSSPGFRDVMATGFWCGGGRENCPQIPYISNPTLTYNGNPVGTLAQSNGARVMNAVRNFAADWRLSQATPVGFSDQTPPFGVLDTPAANAVNGLNGQISVTGWTLDNVAVEKVQIYRDPHSTDPPAAIGSNGLVYIGDATFVPGARSDIRNLYPTYPFNNEAGWGYAMLTYGLPNRGNGTFKIYAFARDFAGNSFALGDRTITCNNSSRLKPVGTIDRPQSGEIISGASFLNSGWVLAPAPGQIPVNGSTIRLWMDGQILANTVTYQQSRPDVTAVFPGWPNSSAPGASFTFDTRAFSNGIHEIYWTASDDRGEQDGIGSRIITIQNGTVGNDQPTPEVSASTPPILPDFAGGAPEASSAASWRLNHGRAEMLPGLWRGERRFWLKKEEHVEIHLGEPISVPMQSLPIGASVDTSRGVFYWHVPAAFAGQHRIKIQSQSGTQWLTFEIDFETGN